MHDEQSNQNNNVPIKKLHGESEIIYKRKSYPKLKNTIFLKDKKLFLVLIIYHFYHFNPCHFNLNNFIFVVSVPSNSKTISNIVCKDLSNICTVQLK